MMYALNPYQRDGLQYCLSVQHPALFWDMRLRKTLVAIRWIKILNKWPVLILCPNSAIDEWYKQLIDENLPSLSLTGDRRNRLETLYLKSPIFIINHDGYQCIPEIGSYPFKIVILDESHIIRNLKGKGKNQMTRFYLSNFRNAEHRMILSGTSMPENEIDIFNQLAFLSSDMTRSYRNYWEFNNDCFDNVNYKLIIKPKGSKWIAEKLKLCSVKRYNDVGIEDLIIEKEIKVKLPDRIMEVYNRLFKEFILSNEWLEKATISSGARYVWMRQLIGGFVEDSCEHCTKIDSIFDIYNKIKGKQFVIWSRFNNEVQYIAQQLHIPFINGTISQKERSKIINQFRNKEFNILVANPYCFAHGGNLSFCDAQVFYSLPESGLIFNQSRRRIFDIDQGTEKQCYILIAENTIDEIIIDALHRKNSVSKAIFDYVRKVNYVL